MRNLKKSRYSPVTAFFMLPRFLVMLVLLTLLSCESKSTHLKFSGQTMGTYYRLTLINVPALLRNEILLQAEVDEKLGNLNAMMSTYIPDSEISQFNQAALGSCMSVSGEFFEVIEKALEIYHLSGGAFNPLIGPLVNRWGFGSTNNEFVFPTQNEIKDLLEQSNIRNISLDKRTSSLCKHGELTLDLSAIAKGYAVDVIAKYLFEKGLENFLVDIGGEIKVAGKNQHDLYWKIAIEQPENTIDSVFEVLSLTDLSVATSGDYRNYFEYNGQRYSHTISPVTGLPISHSMTSVTVIHDSAMIADAWATALNVIGSDKIHLLAKSQQLAVYTIERDNSSSSEQYKAWHSQATLPYLVNY